MTKNKLYWRINSDIRSPQLRLIGSDGKQIGVVSRDEALEQAKKSGLDLVEIAPMVKPPVAKIVDFGKFRYAEEKKLKAQKKKAKTSELKEVRFSPFIAEADYQTRLRKLEQFLAQGHKIKTVVVFKGRQMGSKKFGYELLEKILANFGEKVTTDMKPKFLGRHLVMIISPLKKQKKEKEKEL